MTIDLTTKEEEDRYRRTTLAGFAYSMSGGQWLPYPHVRYLAGVVERAAIDGGKRLIVNMPPRHGKSELISHWLPAWWLYWNPTTAVTLASYQGEYANEWAYRVRQEFLDHDLGLQVNKNSKRVSAWTIIGRDEKGRKTFGRMYATGVGGAITGRGSRIIIIDDPTKNWEDAHSTAAKRKLRNWFTSTFFTRREPEATMILIMTRWAEDDLTAWLLDQPSGSQWQQITMPALAEEGDPMGRAPGEALCPERYDARELLSIKEQIGSAQFNCLYQQRPVDDGSTVFRRLWFKNFYDVRPEPGEFDEIVMVCDLTLGSLNDSASRVVIDILGRKGADKYLLDEWRDTADFPATISAIRMMSAKWPRAERKLVEDKANGPAAISTLQHEIPGIIAVSPGGKSKEIRAQAVTPSVEAGNLWLPSPEIAPWIDDWLEEVCSFPNGKHDDRVDTLCYGLSYFADEQSQRIVKYSQVVYSESSSERVEVLVELKSDVLGHYYRACNAKTGEEVRLEKERHGSGEEAKKASEAWIHSSGGRYVEVVRVASWAPEGGTTLAGVVFAVDVAAGAIRVESAIFSADSYADRMKLVADTAQSVSAKFSLYEFSGQNRDGALFLRNVSPQVRVSPWPARGDKMHRLDRCTAWMDRGLLTFAREMEPTKTKGADLVGALLTAPSSTCSELCDAFSQGVDFIGARLLPRRLEQASKPVELKQSASQGVVYGVPAPVPDGPQMHATQGNAIASSDLASQIRKMGGGR
ncbi:MAG: phage terminase large subunit [Patescibacteria group bacterium]